MPEAGAPRLELLRRYCFAAARRLPRLPPDHPCARWHGHNFRVELGVQGPLDPDSGWVMDFAALDRLMRPLLEQLDHCCLNELPGLENPTSEHIACWLWQRLAPQLPGLAVVTLWEDEAAGCRYSGPP